MTDRILCGWRVRSALPLPDLLPWTGDAREPDLHIRLGHVPGCVEDPTFEGTLLQLGRDGCARYAVPGVAAYWVNPAGRSVTVEPAAAGATAVRAFLFGTVFAILCQRRGLLPLHACCIRLDGPEGPCAAAFAGPSGIGKSTLAAAFRQRGHTVLADDVTVLQVEAGGPATVLPGLPRLKLWRDSLDRLDLPVEGLERVREETEKYSMPLDPAFSAAPLPLAAVYYLERVNDPRHGERRRLRGVNAVLKFSQNVYRDRVLARLGDAKADVLARAARAAAAVPRHWTLARTLDFAGLDALVEDLARHVGDGGEI